VSRDGNCESGEFVAESLFLDLHEQPLGKEGEDFLPGLRGCVQEVHGLGHEPGDVHVQPEPPDDLVDAPGGPPEAVGVLGAAGFEPDFVAAHDDVGPLGEADKGAGYFAGEFAARGLGEILVVECPGHFFGFAVAESVFSAHEPLEFGEFVDHVGDEVSLGEIRRPVHHGNEVVHPHIAAETEGQLPGGHDLVMEGAELHLVDDVFQPLHVGGQGVFQVLRPEEGGILEAGPEDPLVALPDHRHVGRQVVAHTHEVGKEPAVLSPDGEILLVLFHGSGEHFLGHFQVLPAEGPEEGDGVLHQVEVLVDDFGIELRGAVHVLLKGGDAGEHLLAPLVLVEDDVVVVELVHEVGSIGDGDVPGAHEPMPHGVVSAPDPTVLEGDDLPVRHGEDPPDGPGEADRGIVPVHVLGEDELPDEAGQKLGKYVEGPPAGLGDLGAGIAHAVNLHRGELFDGDAPALGEAVGSPGGVAVDVEGGVPCRALEGVDQVGLPLVGVPHDEGDPPGGGEGGKALEAYPCGSQIVPGGLLEEFEGVRQEARGDFFGSDFEKDVFQHHGDYLLAVSPANFPRKGRPMARLWAA